MSSTVYTFLKSILPERVSKAVEQLSFDELASLTLSELGITSMETVEILVKIEESYQMEFSENDLLQFGFLRFEEIVSLVEFCASKS
jgi:Phosphopantetheine attachment site.